MTAAPTTICEYGSAKESHRPSQVSVPPSPSASFAASASAADSVSISSPSPMGGGPASLRAFAQAGPSRGSELGSSPLQPHIIQPCARSPASTAPSASAAISAEPSSTPQVREARSEPANATGHESCTSTHQPLPNASATLGAAAATTTPSAQTAA
eukprot:5032672-Pleurochrysis_carterae.AAC.1